MGLIGDDKKWSKERLTYLELGRLKDILRDLKTFERNTKLLNE